MTDFEKKSLETALQRLLDNNNINKEQRDILMEMYQKDERSYPEIHEEINKLRFDKDLLDTKLNKNIIIANQSINNEPNKEVKVSLNIENIEEFTKESDGKTYIKIHYPYPVDKVEMIEKGPSLQNYNVKEIFEEIQRKYGIDNSTAIFKQILMEKCKEIPTKDIEEFCRQTEFEKLSVEQKNSIIAIKKIERYKDKKITASPQEGIFVISEPGLVTGDFIVEVSKKLIGGKMAYVVDPIEQKTYKNDLTNEVQETLEDDSFIEENEEIIKKDDEQYKFVLTRKKRKKNKEAAFVNMLWFVVLAGVICAILIAIILTK